MLGWLTCDVDDGDTPADAPAPAHQTEGDGDELGQGDDEVDQEAAHPVEGVWPLPPPGAQGGGAPGNHQDS